MEQEEEKKERVSTLGIKDIMTTKLGLSPWLRQDSGKKTEKGLRLPQVIPMLFNAVIMKALGVGGHPFRSTALSQTVLCSPVLTCKHM